MAVDYKIPFENVEFIAMPHTVVLECINLDGLLEYTFVPKDVFQDKEQEGCFLDRIRRGEIPYIWYPPMEVFYQAVCYIVGNHCF